MSGMQMADWFVPCVMEQPLIHALKTNLAVTATAKDL